MTDVSQLLESRQSRIGRWIGAALIVGALHAGVVAALMGLETDDAWDDPAGGVSIDLVAPPAPMPVKSEDLAHGPDRPVGGEATEAAKPAVRKVEKDLPLAEPSPVSKPEVALPKPRPDQKKRPQEETSDAAQKRVAKEEGDDVRTAPPRVEAQPAPAVPKSEGLSAAAARAQAGWMRGLVRELERQKRLPQVARKHRGLWKAVVVFTVDRTGKVLTYGIRERSGIRAIDEEALALLKRVKFPPAPDQLPGAIFEYSVPIRFKLD